MSVMRRESNSGAFHHCTPKMNDRRLAWPIQIADNYSIQANTTKHWAFFAISLLQHSISIAKSILELAHPVPDLFGSNHYDNDPCCESFRNYMQFDHETCDPGTRMLSSRVQLWLHPWSWVDRDLGQTGCKEGQRWCHSTTLYMN